MLFPWKKNRLKDKIFFNKNNHDLIAELKENGIYVIYPTPKKGAEGFLVTFIHPKDTGGVLVELAQES